MFQKIIQIQNTLTKDVVLKYFADVPA